METEVNTPFYKNCNQEYVGGGILFILKELVDEERKFVVLCEIDISKGIRGLEVYPSVH